MLILLCIFTITTQNAGNTTTQNVAMEKATLKNAHKTCLKKSTMDLHQIVPWKCLNTKEVGRLTQEIRHKFCSIKNGWTGAVLVRGGL